MVWTRGTSGNPQGRKKGTRNRRTLKIDRYRRLVLSKLVKFIREDDREIIQFVAGRMLPPLKAVLVPVQLPDLASAPTLDGAGRAVIDAAARGKLTPDHTESYLNALLQQAELSEHAALMERIARLEAQLNQQGTESPPPSSKRKPRERL